MGVGEPARDLLAVTGDERDGGALVEQVTPGGPAAKSGLKGGTQTQTVQGQSFTIGGDVITASMRFTNSGENFRRTAPKPMDCSLPVRAGRSER